MAAGRGARVAGELDEVEAVRDPDRSRQVGDEDEARLERGDEKWLPIGVVGGDLRAELDHAHCDVLRREVDLADRRVRGYEASSRWYRWASRSTSRL